LLTAPDGNRPRRTRKLLLFITEDYYVVSHRLPLAVAAQASGYDVTIVTRVRNCGDVIRRAGLRLIPFENARSSLNPFSDLWALARLVALYRREQPDIVHHVAMKPVLYGSLAAKTVRRARVVNALAGMGWLFSEKGGARWLTPIVRRALKRLAASGLTIVQNPDDRAMLVELGIDPARIRLIAGAGVDLDLFRPSVAPNGPPTVVMPTRLLWDKGVGEFVAAARLLRARRIEARFVLAGEPDPLNPASVSADDVRGWVREGVIEHPGFVADMPGLLARSHIVCLPSYYREGVPKSLIEAAAAARPIVTADAPGCREVVRHGYNGLLVPPRSTTELATALERLIVDPALRDEMGRRGRALAEGQFGQDTIIRQTLAVYDELTT
jgi:glycosyltransferase involved in cell wall biosynthesis